MTEGRWPADTADFSGAMTFAGMGNPIPIVFSLYQANEASSAGFFDYMICVDLPRAKVCRNMPEAVKFFQEGKK